jgi:predicted small lipoprotein YifL
MSKIRVRFDWLSLIILLLGFAALIASIVATSSVLAFVGLGMVFWGVILMYIRSGKYVKENIMEATATSVLLTLNETLEAIGYNGKPLYLPPKYLTNPDESKVYIPRLMNDTPPTPEQTRELENQRPSRDSNGILLTPPGAKLAELFEKTLGTSFARTDMNKLLRDLPKLMIEDLEIASNFTGAVRAGNTREPSKTNRTQPPRNSDRIHVALTGSVYKETQRETEQTSNIVGNLGWPIISAIACAIAKATGKLTVLENEKTSTDGSTIEADYVTFEEE